MAADLLRAWLTAALAFGAVPAGSLVLLLMMRMIPGVWGEQLRLSAEAGAMLVPAAALAMLPVALGLALLYPWMHVPSATGFQRFWLGPLPWLGCSLAWFAGQWTVARRMRRRQAPITTAAIGLLLLPLLGFLVAVEWLLSLEPGYASSVIGLQLLLIEVTIAFCALVPMRLAIGRTPPRPGVLGALILTLALLGGYFEFLPFFIAWSDNLPDNAAWYLTRPTAPAWAFALLGGWPILALLFADVRRSPRWLMLIAASLLAAKLAELAWFVRAGPWTLPAAALLALAAALLLPRALRRRIAARTAQ